MESKYKKDLQYYKFCFYGFLKNLRFFDAFLILFFLESEIDFLEIGILYSIREIVLMVFEIPSGIISDSFGRRKTLAISFLIYIASFLIFYLSSTYVVFVFAMCLIAIADAFRTGVHKAMIFQYLKSNNWSNQKIDYYGNTRSWSQTGSAFSALISAALVFWYLDYRIIFLASVVPYIIDTLLVLSYPRYLEGEVSYLSINKVRSKFIEVYLAIQQTLKTRLYFTTLTNLSIFTGYSRVIKDYIQPIIAILAISIPILSNYTDNQKIAVIVGVIYFLMFLITSIASRYAGKFKSLFKNHYRPMNFTLIFGLLMGIMVGIFVQGDALILSILCFFTIMIIENLRKPIGIGIIANISKDKAMATSLSITSQAKSLFVAFIAPSIGWLADLYGPGIGVTAISIGIIILSPAFLFSNNHG